MGGPLDRQEERTGGLCGGGLPGGEDRGTLTRGAAARRSDRTGRGWRVDATTVEVIAILLLATLVRSAFGFGEALISVLNADMLAESIAWTPKRPGPRKVSDCPLTPTCLGPVRVPSML